MNNNKAFKQICTMGCFILMSNVSLALDLLDKPAIASTLVEKSILTGLTQSNNHVFAVGERGHILNWQSPGQWQQDKVPVSVMLTAATTLPDGTKVAVGHDSAIIICDTDTNQWRKVFDGYDLIDLKIALFEKQITTKKAQIAASGDDADKLEELEYQLEDLAFTLEDAFSEKTNGPDKPLLSVAAVSNNKIFAVGAYGTLLLSEDKGKSWLLVDEIIDNPDKFHLNSISNTTDGKVYIVGENGTGYVSTDQGDTWESMNMPYAGSIFGINTQDGSDNLIAYGLQGNLMASVDAGTTWSHKKMPTSASFLGGILGTDGKAYVVGHGGMIANFNVDNLSAVKIKKHPSGAAFSAVLIKDDALILVGQHGITSWQLK